MNFIDFSNGEANMGLSANTIRAGNNKTWLGYNNQNYIRGNTYLSGVLYDENDANFYADPAGTSNLKTLCINGDCKTTWPGGTTPSGTITGKYVWSTTETNSSYTNAVSLCQNLAPAGTWRVPSSDEIEYSRFINASLFNGSKWYWTRSPRSNIYNFTYYPTSDYWYECNRTQSNTNCNSPSNYIGNPTAVRCVADVN